jgi:hypothetical protein
LHSEEETGMEVMSYKKATGDEDIILNAFKILGKVASKKDTTAQKCT